MSALKPTETFMLSMKLSFFAGIILAFPLLLMFILQFVLPGLHANEKRVLWPSMAVGFGLFLGGVFFAYFAVLPRALTFFYEWSGSLGVSNDWRIGEYISFATQFTLLFGVAFELPVVVMVFVKLGLLAYETMSRTRSYAIVAIFVAAAILTPTPDVFTLDADGRADDHPLRNLHLAGVVRPPQEPDAGRAGSPRERGTPDEARQRSVRNPATSRRMRRISRTIPTTKPRRSATTVTGIRA